MRVLIACEESQTECKAFRELGHEAYSCDIVECTGGHPEWHIKGDALEALHSGKWDLVIAHPPCTYLSNAGAARLFKRIDGQSWINAERFAQGLKAKEFFMEFVKYGEQGHRIAIENPVPSSIFQLPERTQLVQPYEYGHPYSKKTCLWLYGLPQLKPTEIVEPICSWVSGGSKKADGTPRENKGMTFRDSCRKSKSFPGIAKAMAEQWTK